MNFVLCLDSKKDLSSTTAVARDAGFAAIELTADDRADSPSVTNLLWSSAKSIDQKLGGLSVGSVRTCGDWATIVRAITAAASVRCPLVRAVGVDLSPGKNRFKTAREAGDVAAAAGVVVAIELPNLRHGVTAAWTFLDAVGHPAVGCCWTAGHTTAGSVSIPTLSNWIRAARLTDDDRSAIDRLHGIGFQGPWLIGPTSDPGRFRDGLLAK